MTSSSSRGDSRHNERILSTLKRNLPSDMMAEISERMGALVASAGTSYETKTWLDFVTALARHPSRVRPAGAEDPLLKVLLMCPERVKGEARRIILSGGITRSDSAMAARPAPMEIEIEDDNLPAAAAADGAASRASNTPAGSSASSNRKRHPPLFPPKDPPPPSSKASKRTESANGAATRRKGQSFHQRVGYEGAERDTPFRPQRAAKQPPGGAGASARRNQGKIDPSAAIERRKKKAREGNGEISFDAPVVSVASLSLEDDSRDAVPPLAQNENKIHDTKVYFPFRPARAQLVAMRTVLEALKETTPSREGGGGGGGEGEGQDGGDVDMAAAAAGDKDKATTNLPPVGKDDLNVAFVECPTGTGKTIALLCSVLAYQHSMAQEAAEGRIKPEQVPRVFYATRTHKQLDQVVSELKKTPYRPLMTLLASRERFCLHHTVMAAPNKAEACENATFIDNMECMHLQHHEGIRYPANFLKHYTPGREGHLAAFDIEELVKEGNEAFICPYHTTRDLLSEGAALILLTYSQVFDPPIRTANSLFNALPGSILILDEGHNIDSVCRDVATLELTTTKLYEMLEDLQRMHEVLASNAEHSNLLPINASFQTLIYDLMSFTLAQHSEATSTRPPPSAPAPPPAPAPSRAPKPISRTSSMNSISAEPPRGLPVGATGWRQVNLSSGGVGGNGGDKEVTHWVQAGTDALGKLIGISDLSRPTVKRLQDQIRQMRKALQAEGFESTAVKSGTINALEGLLSRLDFFIHSRGEPYKCCISALHTAPLQGAARGGAAASHGIGSAPRRRAKKMTRQEKETRHLAAKHRYADLTGNSDDSRPPFEATLTLLCLDASVAFRPVVEWTQLTILASGTLSPMDALARELISFGLKPSKSSPRPLPPVSTDGLQKAIHVSTVQQGEDGEDEGEARTVAVRLWALTAPHFASLQDNLVSRLLQYGPVGLEGFKRGGGGKDRFAKLDMSYQCRRQPDQQDALGGAIVALAHIVPNGLLVFVPSYGVLKMLVDRWRVSGHMAEMEKRKRVLVEQQGMSADAFDQMLKTYHDAAKDKKGVLLLGVCRGRASEGVNFKDHNARGVLIAGIPYPPLKDLQSVLKREYNDAESRKGEEGAVVSGNEFYQMEAFRAVNQCLGRLLRHSKDYGCAILLEQRYAQQTHRLPGWFTGQLPPIPSQFSARNAFSDTLKDVGAFFKNKSDANLPPQPQAPQPSDPTRPRLDGQAMIMNRGVAPSSRGPSSRASSRESSRGSSRDGQKGRRKGK
ncbi:unnamed protein product [Vitrella brassicaformis CCMP3155]|uniref:Helicase ATP-binding domain-containing protein n=1 Tax=Vitrella brassicaformis (strain CCMP3155) TaxID=1169540 RepID=A0A0G4F8E8_VITBC|nr:unnamed protein product [Vitrella brassicaformis CCMP3155]|eukprot:CEM08978.1 unnamed protein product [Vitrella brassicaformis CCMP3155]